MPQIMNYRDLEVWNIGRTLVKCIYEITPILPNNEQYGLVSQMRRAAISIPSNIAEGHSRHSTKDYIQFVSIAIGSLAELDTQLVLCEDLKYVTGPQTMPVKSMIELLQKKLHSLRRSLRSKP